MFVLSALPPVSLSQHPMDFKHGKDCNSQHPPALPLLTVSWLLINCICSYLLPQHLRTHSFTVSLWSANQSHRCELLVYWTYLDSNFWPCYSLTFDNPVCLVFCIFTSTACLATLKFCLKYFSNWGPKNAQGSVKQSQKFYEYFI